MRKLTVHIAKSHEEAEDHDIAQMRSMTSSERLEAAVELQELTHGKDAVRVRDSGVYRIRSVKQKDE